MLKNQVILGTPEGAMGWLALKKRFGGSVFRCIKELDSEAPGCYLEVTRKSLVRLDLAPQWNSSFLREVSSSGGIMISCQRCGRGPARKVHMRRRVCEHTQVCFAGKRTHCGFSGPETICFRARRTLRNSGAW